MPTYAMVYTYDIIMCNIQAEKNGSFVPHLIRGLPLITYASRGGGGSTLMHTIAYKGGGGV